MPNLYRKKWWLQPHAVLWVQTWFLLDVSRRLEDSRIWVLPLLALRRESECGQRIFARSCQGSAKEIPPLLRAGWFLIFYYYQLLTFLTDLCFFFFSVGKPRQELAPWRANAATDSRTHSVQSYDGYWRNLDRLAVSVGCCCFTRSLPLHSPVHVPLRLLHGSWISQRIGTFIYLKNVLDKSNRKSFNLVSNSSSTSKLSWRLRLRIFLGKWSVPKQRTVATSASRWTFARNVELLCYKIFWNHNN